MDLTIRTAVMEDAMAIARVGLDSHIEAYRPLLGEDYGAGAGLEATAQYWRKLLSHDSSVEHVELEVLVAEKDGEISAYSGIGASRDPDGAGAGEVFTLYVHPSSWRTGLGRRLLAAATTHLHEMGYQEVTLWVLELNERAQAFYSSQGWRPDGATEASRHVPHRNLRYLAPKVSGLHHGVDNPGSLKAERKPGP